MDFDDFFGFLSLTIRRYLTVSHVPFDFKLYKELANIKRKKLKKSEVRWGIIINLFEVICRKIDLFPGKIRLLHFGLLLDSAG